MISSLIIGLIAGTLGKLIMPGKDPGGIIVTLLLGLAGSFVGGFVGRFIPFISNEGGFSIGNIVTSTIGAIILLLIYRVIMSKKSK